MNKKLQDILNLIQQSEKLDAEQKDNLIKAVKDADKELEITAFKLERTEKVKKTTAILLEETIEELEQKRKAVEAQNRELEIESSLERVRAVAMSMNKSDDLLKICEVSFKEFQKLGFDNLRNAIIHVLNDEKRFFMDYDYSDYLGGGINKISYDSHPILEDYLKQIKKADDAFAEVVIDGDQLDSWKDFRRKGGQQDDLKLDNIPALYYYMYSIGVGDIGISTLKPIDESQINILKRFRNVFDLAYRRYNDIALAEAQAREAQIQLALERVRARTMAMQKSEELPEAANLLFQQVQSLGMPAWSAGYCIWSDNKQTVTLWMSTESALQPPFTAPTTKDELFIQMRVGEEMDKALHIVEMGGDDLVAHYKYMHTLPVVGEILDSVVKAGHPLPVFQIMHYAYFSQGFLLFITYEPVPEEHDIFKRFAKVFEQTYTRFLDLQKAEAQARKAQIEAALERVRSLAQGMHRSEEVGNVTDKLFEELNKLTLKVIGCTIVVIDEEKDTWETWRARTKVVVKPFEVASFKRSMQLLKKHMPKWFPIFNEGFSAREKYIVEEMTKRRRTQLLNSIAEQYNYTEKEKTKLLKITPDKITAHFLFFKLGYLALITEKRLPDDNLTVAGRFVEVFSFAYTRFLDIKNAEEQAREAEIQLALERVRARTMAMYSSDELMETSQVLFEQFNRLGENAEQISIAIINEEENTFEVYVTYQGNKFERLFKAKFDSHPVIKKIHSAWKSGNKSAVIEISGDELKSYNDWRSKLGEVKYQSSGYEAADKWIMNLAFFSKGMISLSTYYPLPDATINLLERFAAVFDLTYTRFLDLQKAEAQTREAEIQLALERVRARTMAMHKSDELAETSFVLFNQLKELGEVAEQISIGIYDEEKEIMELYATIYGNQWEDIGKIPYDKHIVHQKTYKAWKEKKKSIVVDLTGDELNDFNKFKMKYSTQYKSKDDLPKHRWIIHQVFFSKGVLSFSTHEPRPPETINLLERFASVFDGTYTRFLDLKKAEAQTREAEIQLALERVRARTMAMHKSEELSETVAVLFQQLNDLGNLPERMNIGTVKEEEGIFEFWSTEQGGNKIDHLFTSGFDEPTTMSKVYQGWKEKKKSLVIDLSGKELTDWIRYLREDIHMPVKEELLQNRRVHSVAFFSQGVILMTTPEPMPEETINLLERFAKVFEQTYTRFLDLQKAEAQAREAQIEAALERVRSRTMAMHKSDEIKDVVATVMDKMNELNIEMNGGISLATFIEGSQDLLHWYVNPAQVDGPVTMHLPYFDNILFHDFVKARKESKELLPVVYSFEQKNNYFEYTFEHSDFKIIPEELKKWILEQPYFGYSVAIQKHSAIFFNDYTGKLFSEEENEVLLRFAKVFDQAYIRFLDLQKAEAQAREAIKQASLDRIRGEIASMRTSEDLNRITPIIWRELKALEVPFIRCGVFIVNERNKKVQVYLTTPDGKSLGVLNLPFEANEITKNTVEYWREKKVYKEHWNKEEFINWTKSMIEIGQVQNAETYQGSTNPPDSLDLHFVPFTQGMLYVGNSTPLTDEKLQLVKSLTDAFSIAYARYEDFQRLEAAKAEVESAFGELDILSKELKVKNEVLETENERKAMELEEARQLQLSMLPKVLPELPNLDIAVYMKTATEVGGDYYDFQVGNDGTLTAVIGDATGHGMKAGTMVTITKSLFNSLAADEDILDTFSKISRVIKDMKFRRFSMCLLLLKINGERLYLSSAAMPPVFIYREKKREIEEILVKGMPLGAINNFPYTVKETRLEKGDTILLLSDGLPELLDKKNKIYGYERTKSEFLSVGNKRPDTIVEHLKNSAFQWVNGKESDDDITFVVIKVK
jgi:serine phosphatase RsbU (regulator of sigma subunit)